LALKELPLTAEMGKALPDKISMALRDCFGRMTGSCLVVDGEAVLDGWGKCTWGGAGKEGGEEREKKLPIR